MRTRLASSGFFVALAVMLLAAVGFSAGVRYFGVYLRKEAIYPRDGRRVDAIPAETQRWKRVGDDHRETAEIEETLGTKNYVSRWYRRKDESGQSAQLELHAAYYTGGIDTVPHVPDRCLVGGGMVQSDVAMTLPLAVDRAGWVPDDEASKEGTIYTVRTSNTFSDLPGRRLRLPRGCEDIRLRIMPFTDGRVQIYVGYFFIANGGLVTTAEEVRQLSFDLTDDYAYFLKVQFMSPTARSAEELAAQASDLLTDLLPELMRCVPDWTEVERGEYPPGNPRAKKPADAASAGAEKE